MLIEGYTWRTGEIESCIRCEWEAYDYKLGKKADNGSDGIV